MTKDQIKTRITNISKFVSLKFIHMFTIIALIPFFLWESLAYQNLEIIYALFLIVVMPIFLSSQIKESKEEVILPYLTEHYQYSNHNLKVQIYVFLVDSIGLFFLQLGNFLFPYNLFLLQYIPLFLLLVRIIIRFLFTLVFRAILHHKLMNNLI